MERGEKEEAEDNNGVERGAYQLKHDWLAEDQSLLLKIGQTGQ